MKDADHRRGMLARTQLLTAVVSLIPLAFLFYVADRWVFPALLSTGQQTLLYGTATALVLCAGAVILGYVLVRRDTTRTIELLSEGERRLQGMHQAAMAIAQLDRLDAVRDALLEHAVALVGAEVGALWVPGRDEVSVYAARGMSLERAKAMPLPVGQGSVGGAAADRQARVVPELSDTDRTWDDRVAVRTRGMIVVPLQHRGALVGVLDLRNKRGGGHFDGADLQVAEGLAGQATLALDNAAFRDHTYNYDRQVTTLVREISDRLTWPGHIDNVLRLSDRLAERMALSADKRRVLKTAAILHDIGLLDCEPEQDTPGGASRHVLAGAERLERVELWHEAAAVVRAHHERTDGSGPCGLRGFAIPLPARILALAEAVDTRTNPASPWGNLGLPDLLERLKQEDHAGFDEKVVEAFLAEVQEPSEPAA